MKNLKKLRLQKGLSQQALANKLGTSQQSIYKYENLITEPSLDMLQNMADFFNVSVDYIIGYSSYAHKIEETHETSLNQDELLLLTKYRSLPASTKQTVQSLLSEFTQQS